MVEMVEVNAELVHETDLAYLIDEGGKRHWLPKSLTEYDGQITFMVPEYLAVEKGLC